MPEAHDPHTERLIQQRLAQAAAEGAQPPPRMLPAGQVWGKCGQCPECGAPIWFAAAAPADNVPPQHHYTCPCTEVARAQAFQAMNAMHAAAQRANGEGP